MTETRKQNICIVILAGGKSSRMGQPKELLEWDGKPLIEHLVQTVCRTGLPCVIVSNWPERLPEEVRLLPQVEVKRDAWPSRGPISGILTAMTSTDADAYLVFACDLPFLETEHVQRMIGYAQTLAADAALAKTAQREHPLFGVYHRRTKPVWERSLANGEYRVMSAVSQMKWVPLEENWLDCWVTFNMNTPHDYEIAVRERIRRKREQGKDGNNFV